MTTSTNLPEHHENLNSLQAALLELLAGMNYCLDWKPDEATWSAREIVYHILDTPPGGMPTIVQGIISGEITEYEIRSGHSNITPTRSTLDLTEVESDIAQFFAAFNKALTTANDADLQRKQATMHQRTRQQDEERTLETVLTGFTNHCRNHLTQLNQLRTALGF